MQYLSLPSAIRPQSHSVEIPVPIFGTLSCLDQDEYDVEVCSSTDSDFVIKDDCVHKGFDQNELSDLVHDLGLSKKASEILSSRLHEKNLLEKGTKVTFHRTREREMLKYFRSERRFI